MKLLFIMSLLEKRKSAENQVLPLDMTALANANFASATPQLSYDRPSPHGAVSCLLSDSRRFWTMRNILHRPVKTALYTI
jgi:hypothetical protein